MPRGGRRSRWRTLLTAMATTQTGAHVLVEQGPTARITLNRPEKRNALSLELMEELIGVLRSVSADPETRAIVLEGAGPAFSAGHDLGEMVGRDLAFYQRLFDVCTELMETIHRLPQPVIAKVHGVATAAGCQLVAACDLAVAADDARFATPGVKIGLFCSTPMVPLSRAIGRKRALEMLLTGELDRRADGARLGPRQPRRPGGRARRRGRRARRDDRPLQPAHGRDRQGGVLRAGRARRAPRVRPDQVGDGDELARRRRAGGHVRVPREAPAGLEGRVGLSRRARARRAMPSRAASARG